MNPFAQWLEDMAEFEERTRKERAALHARRDDIGIALLQEGRTLKQINDLLGTKNPNWLYDACARRGVGTPKEVRQKALESASVPVLDVVPADGGFLVTAVRTDERAMFVWDERAGAYAPRDVKTVPGSDLHKAVKVFGRGLLPFPYTTPNP